MIAQPPEIQPYNLLCTPMNKSEYSRIVMIVLIMALMIVFIMGAAFISLLIAEYFASYIETSVKISLEMLEECV
ncbi:orph-F3 [Microplitis demolitor]|nr:orph-F3 [Microplitis demolitor]